MYIYIYIHVCKGIFTYVYVYVYIYMYVYTYIYIYVYIYILYNYYICASSSYHKSRIELCIYVYTCYIYIYIYLLVCTHMQISRSYLPEFRSPARIGIPAGLCRSIPPWAWDLCRICMGTLGQTLRGGLGQDLSIGNESSSQLTKYTKSYFSERLKPPAGIHILSTHVIRLIYHIVSLYILTHDVS